MSLPPSPKPRRDPLLTWVIIGSVVVLLLCGGVVAATYLVYQRGGQVAEPVADTEALCSDGQGLRAHLLPAPPAAPAATGSTAGTDDAVVIGMQATFWSSTEQKFRESLAKYQFLCAVVRTWPLGDDANADVQLLQFASKEQAVNFYIATVQPYKQQAAAADIAYVNGVDEGFVATRKPADGRIHAMGFTVKGAVLVVAEIYGKKRPDAAAVGDLLRQQLEKA